MSHDTRDPRERTGEPRDIWMIVRDGRPAGFRWSLDEAGALRGEAPGASAVRTSWRFVPDLLVPGRAGPLGAVVGDGFVDVAGLRYYVGDRGRTHPAATADRPMEPMQPDAEIVDPDVLLALVEQAGRPFEVVERRTLKRVRFRPDRRGVDGQEAAAVSDLAHDDVDVVVRQADGSVRRLDAKRAPGAAAPADPRALP